ncbi:MAG TPA: HNH endonuclease signature motif containing protein [Mycobacterium sp.]|nr:HNH endonuclease signature motif containing protein [Mycobacterium sp.]
MFEGVGDGELIEVMGEATRDESTAIAQRLAAVAELFVRRSGQLAGLEWCVADGCDAVAAEVSAVQNISHARAVGQVQLACALQYRLPAVARVFARGTIDFRMVSTIVARTDNVEAEVMAALDAAIARQAEKWMKLSKPKLRDRVDQWVAKFDPAGVRVPREVTDNRYVEIQPTVPGMAGVSGHIDAADGAALDQRLDAVAATVCEHDPRTAMQRRSDACGALGRGEASLVCRCGLADCPATAERNAAAAVVHVLAEQATLDGSSDAPGYLRGFGILPAESVRELAATAQLKPVTVPTGATPDPGYRPSAKTAEFVRWRDVTCRWPGCDKPAERCDIDHTTPWPYGPTHASNNKPYCRIHHLLKTFCGWFDEQLPDGTILLTAPSGHVYRTEAHGAAMFPALGQSTGELKFPPVLQAAETDRTAMMPRRKRTREQERRDRINAERRERTELIAEEERQRQAWLAQNYQPPPF